MPKEYKIPNLPLSYDLETKAVLRQLNFANKKLAELKGVALTIPNENILISTLTLQEAKDSSEVENIVTTQDDLYKADLGIKGNFIKAAEKEVMNYRNALISGYQHVKRNHILSINTIKDIQKALENNSAGFRKLPGTNLKNQAGDIVYTPPQNGVEIESSMANLEAFINDNSICDLDPLVKMAIIHHQFESIHPFYDGNGRTGRIVLILFLVMSDLLDLPILYLSRYITHNKGEYYRLIQEIRDYDGDNFEQWERWVLFILKGVEETANQTINLVKGISMLMADYKTKLRPKFGRLYKHELLNNLFYHPYTKIEYVERDMMVSRNTASSYLNKIVKMGLLTKMKVGKSNYYINTKLMELFLNVNGQQIQ
ncbi:MAG: Fic family protein [Bacteroidaceae bacterium]|nr:Fic family protein [Bacteroidaceae bacterium]